MLCYSSVNLIAFRKLIQIAAITGCIKGKFVRIYDKNELTALLISYGLTSDQFSFYYENDAINGIQGNEADYVVVYKLKASDNILNIDSDLQSMYTYLTRSKDYTLIYEPSILSEGVEKNNGLFTANKVKSEFDKGIKEYSSSVTQD